MDVRRRFLGAALAACALVACGLPARALASHAQQSILMDDNQLIYATPAHMLQTLEKISALGVDRVKVSVVWSLVAPDADSTQRPSFDATDPNAYPPGAWDRYDILVRDASELGLKVYFQLTPPAPMWALPPGQDNNQGEPLGRAPKTSEFRQFVQAVGRRYSGNFGVQVQQQQPPPPPANLLSKLLGGQAQPPPAPGQMAPLPRVDYWGIWNEPNFKSWLNPYYGARRNGQRVLLQPGLYRGLTDAAWQGLQKSGHAGDTILIGEIANDGILTPLDFIRALYCVSNRYRPLTGAAAVHVNCPTSGTRGRFVAQHPGLFKTTGFAHHPYSFNKPPNRPFPDRTWITIFNISTLERVLDQVVGSYGQLHGRTVPLYLTEAGYKTNPPNPFVGTTQAEQANWINESDYMTWKDPRIRANTQFLLVDDGPNKLAPVGTHSYWRTFQTGLIGLNGSPKPAYAAFRIPIWLPNARHGARVTVWGQLRPANRAAPQRGELQFRRRGSRSWGKLQAVTANSSEGYLYVHVRIRSAGSVRLQWFDFRSGHFDYSRTVTVS
ncbi:MAG: hypothetical protein DLM64_05675 [Solirubrobacterales bacterium]|nr:MAG: hypothetical protein DLM64_05675 [Solirubrobacterales bacterium]